MRDAAMIEDCLPVTALPGTTKLFRDFLLWHEDQSAAGSPLPESPLRAWFSRWEEGSDEPAHIRLSDEHRERLGAVLTAQALSFGASEAVHANIRLLREGAGAVVTGQQVGLFGGPLLTLLKAATAIARARHATTRTGTPHVPVFWLASEDHDLAEADSCTVVSRRGLETLRMGEPWRGVTTPVGRVSLGEPVDGLLDRMEELLGPGPVCDLLRECYGAPPEGRGDRPTFAGAFGRWMTRLFAVYGLVVLDPAERETHALGATTLRFAIEHAPELETRLLQRGEELVAAGYHAQVQVNAGGSLLFLLADVREQEGVWERLPLRRTPTGWRAGPHVFTTGELLAVLEREPERLSPNALLRPVFQDTILPTAAYVGGPAEIAYFAQSAVVFEQVFGGRTGVDGPAQGGAGARRGRPTPILPRFSATLIEPEIAHLLERFDLALADLLGVADVPALAQRLGARVMPVAAKRRLAEAGGALDGELTALTEYLGSLDPGLGRSAVVAASKMRYQMNRLRRMTAAFEVARDARLERQAATLMYHLLPRRHLQERLLSGSYFLARGGVGLIDRLVTEASDACTVHALLFL